jgi:hypothetical protein
MKFLFQHKPHSYRHGRDEKYIQNLGGKHEKKRLLVGWRQRWNNNIKTDLIEKGCKDVYWIHMAQNVIIN